MGYHLRIRRVAIIIFLLLIAAFFMQLKSDGLAVSKEIMNATIKELGWITQVLGKSAACDVAPELLTWGGQVYHLTNRNTSSEPGHLVGYIQCKKGTFTYTDVPGGEGISDLHINGEVHHELILFVNGRALYSPIEG